MEVPVQATMVIAVLVALEVLAAAGPAEETPAAAVAVMLAAITVPTPANPVVGTTAEVWVEPATIQEATQATKPDNAQEPVKW